MTRKTALFALAAALVLAALPARAEPVVLKFTTLVPAPAPINTRGLEPWMEAVMKDAGGSIDIKMFAGSSLVRSPAGTYRAVKDGIAEIGFVVGAYTPGQFPDEALVQFPVTVTNATEGSVALWRLFEEKHLGGYDDVKVLGFLATGPDGIHLTSPIDSLDDLKGRKFRAANDIQAGIVTALGGVPVGGIAAPQVAESLSRGLVDGTLNNWTALAAFRIDQVTRQAIDFPLGFSVIQIIMNRNAWDALPEQAKAAFEKHSGEALSAHLGRVEDGLSAALRQRFTAEPDRKIRELSAAEAEQWRATFRTLIDGWIAQNTDNAEKYAALERIIADIRANKSGDR